jgi:hypothetical protein
VRRSCSIPSAERPAPCRAKQCLDFRIAGAANSFFEWHNRLTQTILSDQGMSQNEHRVPVCAIRFQDFGCKLLRSTELLHPQRQ